MESNRNLSSIISKIRDEGPPGRDDAPPVAPVDAGHGEAPVPAPADTGRRTSRRLLLGLVLPLFLTIGLVLFAGTHTGSREGSVLAGIRGWFGAAPGIDSATHGEPDVIDEQLVRRLLREQRDIVARLDQLAANVTALSDSVDRKTPGEALPAGLRGEQRADFESLERRVAELQKRLEALVDKQAVKPVSADKTAPAVKAASAVKTPAVARNSPVAKDVPVARNAPVTRNTPAVKAVTAGSRPEDAPGATLSPKTAAAVPPATGTGSESTVTGEEWVVNVASSSREAAMVELAAKLKAQGIPVERQTLTIEGDLMYRLRVPGFTTSGDARQYAAQLDKTHGLRGAWISRR